MTTFVFSRLKAAIVAVLCNLLFPIACRIGEALRRAFPRWWSHA